MALNFVLIRLLLSFLSFVLIQARHVRSNRSKTTHQLPNNNNAGLLALVLLGLLDCWLAGLLGCEQVGPIVRDLTQVDSSRRIRVSESLQVPSLADCWIAGLLDRFNLKALKL